MFNFTYGTPRVSLFGGEEPNEQLNTDKFGRIGIKLVSFAKNQMVKQFKQC